MTALSQRDVARGRLCLVAMAAPGSRRPSRRERRLAARARAVGRARTPMSEAERSHDPLAHRRRSRAGTTVLAVALAVLGIAAHAAVLLAALGISSIGSDGADHPRTVRERIELRSVETRAPEPKPLQRTPDPPAARATPKAEAPRAPVPVPPRDPVATPPAAPPGAATPRRIVGLSLESTVDGAAGPAFAVGNTRMGETASRAEDPASVGAIPPEGNRVAVRVPRAGVAFVAPRKLAPVTPDYPPALRAQGIEGDVVVRVEVDAGGSVARATVLKSSGYPELDDAALRATAAEHWAPASRDGSPVADVVTFTVRFRLTGG